MLAIPPPNVPYPEGAEAILIERHDPVSGQRPGIAGRGAPHPIHPAHQIDLVEAARHGADP
jgi:hypothetical protein